MAYENLAANVLAKGSIVDVSISIWSGRKKLNPQELGLDPGDVNNKLYVLGSKFLIPQDEIGKLNVFRTRSDSHIKAASMKFHGFSGFVPRESLPGLMDKLNTLKTQFFEAVEDLGLRYDELRQNMLNEWNDEAMDTMARQEITDPNWLLVTMTNIQNAFRPWSEIRGSFSFNIKEYNDMNKIFEEFVRESTADIIKEFSKFAISLKEKIEQSGESLNKHTQNSIREHLNELKTKVDLFENSQVKEVWDTLCQFANSDGLKEDLDAMPKFRARFNQAMEQIANMEQQNIDAIAAQSVKNMLSFGNRTIKM